VFFEFKSVVFNLIDFFFFFFDKLYYQKSSLLLDFSLNK
jgi:hypothetical protein